MKYLILILLCLSFRTYGAGIELSVEMELLEENLLKLEDQIDGAAFLKTFVKQECINPTYGFIKNTSGAYTGYLNNFILIYLNSEKRKTCLNFQDHETQKMLLTLKGTDTDLLKFLSKTQWHIDQDKLELTIEKENWYKNIEDYKRDVSFFLTLIGAGNVQPNLGGDLKNEFPKLFALKEEEKWKLFSHYDLYRFLLNLDSIPSYFSPKHYLEAEGLYGFIPSDKVPIKYEEESQRLSIKGNNVKVYGNKLSNGILHVELRYVNVRLNKPLPTNFEMDVNDFFSFIQGKNVEKDLITNVDNKIYSIFNQYLSQNTKIEFIARSPQMLKILMDVIEENQNISSSTKTSILELLIKTWVTQMTSTKLRASFPRGSVRYFLLGHTRILQSNFLEQVLKYGKVSSDDWRNIFSNIYYVYANEKHFSLIVETLEDFFLQSQIHYYQNLKQVINGLENSLSYLENNTFDERLKVLNCSLNLMETK